MDKALSRVPHRDVSPRTLHYRYEIDGLRALAVVAVIVNHLHMQWLPNGHLGVDMFFVISGFVITQSLFTHRHQSLTDFYVSFIARRMRRLAPALLTCFITASIMIWLLVPDRRDSLQTGLFAVFGLSNLFLYLQHVDYFTPSRDLNVFLHTWSLGVEEQFYLLFPAIFWLSSANDRSRLFTRVIGAICLASLAANIGMSRHDPQAAFYLMPFRFWELGAGVLLFVAIKNRHPSGPTTFASRMLPVLAFVTLLVALWVPTAYPALSQCLVVGLTMILIHTIAHNPLALACFSHRSIVYIGAISYPLYLWHWVVLSLSRWLSLDEGGTALQLILILALSIFTYQYIEKPLRNSALLRPNSRAISACVLGSLICAISVAQLRHAGNLFGVSSASERLAGAPGFLPLVGSGLAFDPTCVVDGKSRPLRDDTFDLCTTSPARAGGQTIWAMGDSHAGHLQALLVSLHNKTGLGTHLIETPGTAFPMSPGTVLEARRRIYQMIDERLGPGDIVLLGRLFLDRTGDGVLNDLPQWSTEMVEFARRLADRKVNLVVMGPPPMFQFNTLLACKLVDEHSTCDVDRLPLAKRVAFVQGKLAASARESSNIFLFETFERLCPPSASACSPFKNGQAIFRDRDHLNSAGSEMLTDDFLQFLVTNRLLPNGP